MTGGILQLVAYGKEDLFLTRDPQITFFKVIYRRHTNFAREEIPQYFIHDPNFGKRSTCIIAQDGGDLIGNMSLKITLPAIPKLSTISSVSSEAKEDQRDGVLDQTSTKFAWIRKIGFAMLKYIEIEINGKVIDRHYGEWLYIWSELTTRNINDGGLDKLIGDVPELTSFTESKEEYVLYVPLYFWFCRQSGLALPIVGLQYSDVKVNLEFYELDRCFVISPTHYIKCYGDIVNFHPYEYIYQRGVDNIDRYGMFSHYDSINRRLYYTAINSDKLTGVPYDGDVSTLNDATKNSILTTPRAEKYAIRGVSSDFSIRPDLGVKSVTVHRKSLKTIKLKECVVMADFVYLDDDERIKFAQSKHDYLIEQLYFTPNISIEGTNPKMKLDIDQPCKLMVWLTQLDYVSDFNDRFNFTDSHIIKRPYDVQHTNPTKRKLFGRRSVGETVGNSLIDEETIRLNSQVRLSTRPNEYFEHLQPYQYSKNRLPTGCSMYSYGVIPLDPAPSGTTNMSQIELIELNLKMNYRVNINQKAKFRAYALCYNVWRVDNGLSSPIFIR
ncbi:capsid protein [Yasminevirus sp. GU-2018]|uniref:Capsid protein n=1 Tax=Yasminevirus sp. GU-2018 TaxID=2420051 RepID=A0A5K0U8M0_9VIRU|nr:capsid protein [Yasminevirus sp. GU-2018]